MEFQWICKASGMVWAAKLVQVLALLAVNFGRFAMAQPCKNVLGPGDMVHSEFVLDVTSNDQGRNTSHTSFFLVDAAYICFKFHL